MWIKSTVYQLIVLRDYSICQLNPYRGSNLKLFTLCKASFYNSFCKLIPTILRAFINFIRRDANKRAHSFTIKGPWFCDKISDRGNLLSVKMSCTLNPCSKYSNLYFFPMETSFGLRKAFKPSKAEVNRKIYTLTGFVLSSIYLYWPTLTQITVIRLQTVCFAHICPILCNE